MPILILINKKDIQEEGRYFKKRAGYQD